MCTYVVRDPLIVITEGTKRKIELTSLHWLVLQFDILQLSKVRLGFEITTRAN